MGVGGGATGAGLIGGEAGVGGTTRKVVVGVGRGAGTAAVGVGGGTTGVVSLIGGETGGATGGGTGLDTGGVIGGVPIGAGLVAEGEVAVQPPSGFCLPHPQMFLRAN